MGGMPMGGMPMGGMRMDGMPMGGMPMGLTMGGMPMGGMPMGGMAMGGMPMGGMPMGGMTMGGMPMGGMPMGGGMGMMMPMGGTGGMGGGMGGMPMGGMPMAGMQMDRMPMGGMPMGGMPMGLTMGGMPMGGMAMGGMPMGGMPMGGMPMGGMPMGGMPMGGLPMGGSMGMMMPMGGTGGMGGDSTSVSFEVSSMTSSTVSLDNSLLDNSLLDNSTQQSAPVDCTVFDRVYDPVLSRDPLMETHADDLEMMRRQGAIPKRFQKSLPLPSVREPSPPKEEETEASSTASFDLSDPEEFHRRLIEILSEPAETSTEQLKKFMAIMETKKDGILADTERVEEGIRTVDSPKIVTNASNIARRAIRVLQVAQQEAENSEDPAFVDNVNHASEQLRSTITPMVQCAKVVSMKPQDHVAANNWRKANQGLIGAVGDVRKAVTIYPEGVDGRDLFPPPPDMSRLHIAGQ